MESGQRVVVTYGRLAGTGGAVIKDERFRRHGEVQPSRDRVWVLLDTGDNPQRYRARHLEPVR